MKFTLPALPFSFFSVAAALFLAACASEPPAEPEIQPMRPLPARDYVALRVTGRETIAITPGISVHADHQNPRPDGFVALSGNVYLDGTRHGATDHLWPLHAYSEEALWNPRSATLMMTGTPVCEFATSRITATTSSTRMTLDGHHCKTEGPARTELFSPPPKKEPAQQ